MKLEQGDSFESKNAGWIRTELPHYECVWSAFIGHDGTGKPCTIPGMQAEDERARQLFAQAHYTMAMAMKKVGAIAERLCSNHAEVVDLASFEAHEEDFFLVLAYVGRVRDMFKIMGEALREITLQAPLQDYYAQRSHLLHGPRLPHRVQDGLLMIPKIGGENKLFTEWDNRSTWDSIPTENFIFLSDAALDLQRSFFQKVNEVHGRLFDAASRRFGGRRIAEISNPPFSISSAQMATSACRLSG